MLQGQLALRRIRLGQQVVQGRLLAVQLDLVAQVDGGRFQLASRDHRIGVLARNAARQGELLVRRVRLGQRLGDHGRIAGLGQLDLQRRADEDGVGRGGRRRAVDARRRRPADGGARLVQQALGAGRVAFLEGDEGQTVLGRRHLLAALLLKLGFKEGGGIGQALGRLVLQHAGPGPHQVEVQAVLALLVGLLADAGLDVGDALTGQRVGLQVGRDGVAVRPAGRLQALEESHHAGRVEAGRAHDLEADAVGLALGVAAEIELTLDGQALAAHEHAHGRVAARLGRQRRQHDGRQRDQRVLALLAQRTGDVALHHVADLVAQHGGQLGLALGRQQQGRVDGDEAARQREGVELGIAHGEEIIVEAGLAARAGPRFHQRVAELIQVFEDGRIVEEIVVAPDVAHDFLAQLALHQGRQVLAFRVAQAGQVGDLSRWQRRLRHAQRQHAQQRDGQQAQPRRPAWRTVLGNGEDSISVHGAIIPATGARTQRASNRFPP